MHLEKTPSKELAAFSSLWRKCRHAMPLRHKSHLSTDGDFCLGADVDVAVEMLDLRCIE